MLCRHTMSSKSQRDTYWSMLPTAILRNPASTFTPTQLCTWAHTRSNTASSVTAVTAVLVALVLLAALLRLAAVLLLAVVLGAETDKSLSSKERMST